MRRSIDINCDIGECDDAASVVRERELFRCISTANIACGGHAGDRESMRRCVELAQSHGVAIGAHPSFPDRQNFGRTVVSMAPVDLEDSIARQVEALQAVATDCGGTIRHVKPHGALYHCAMHDSQIASALAHGVGRVTKDVALVGITGAAALSIWADMGWQVLAEAFADRRYEANGRLRDRKFNNAVHGATEATRQALHLACDGKIHLEDGTSLSVEADTICVHSDSPDAVLIAQSIRSGLATKGIAIRPPTPSE